MSAGRRRGSSGATRSGLLLVVLAGGGLLLVVAGLVVALTGPVGRPAARPGDGAAVASSAGPGTDRSDVDRSDAPGDTGVRHDASGDGDERAAQDAVAEAAMPTLPLSAALPQAVSTRDPGAPIVLPVCDKTGPADVPTGCPRTPEGAMAQLVAIDQTALQSGTLLGARTVIDAWAMPGGPTRTSWSGVAAMARLLDGDIGGAATGASVPVVLTPRTGLFKGQVGDDFVVPCVQYELTLTVVRTARVAVADCQRMVWDGTRWMIGPGPEPAQAPNVWPGTDTSVDLGFRDLAWQ